MRDNTTSSIKYKRSSVGLFILAAFISLMIFGNGLFAQDEGNEHVQNSLKMLLAARTIEGDIRIETYVDGKEYTARGRYEEQVLPQGTSGTFLRSMYRLEIYFSLSAPPENDSEPNRMTLVCHPGENGYASQLDCYTFVEGVKSFTTIDLVRLENRLKTANREAVFAQISEVRHLGGLAGMMRQIQRFYEFAPPTHATLHEEENIAAWKLTGTLRSIYKKELLSLFGGMDEKEQYPADFPSDIEVWLGLHNDFPYKIRYLRRQSETSSHKVPLLQESYYKVILNGTPLPASKFTPLSPPDNVFPQDETDNYIKKLGL